MSTRAKMSKSATKGGKKGKDKMASKRNAVTDLTDQNEALLREKEALQQEVTQTATKLSALVHRLVDSLTEKARKKKFHFTRDTDPMKLDVPVLFGIIDYLAENRQQQDVSVAARINDLEARVTEMSMDLARMTMKTMSYEAGFADLLKCHSVDEVENRIYELQFLANQKYQTFAVNDQQKTAVRVASNISLDSDSHNETARLLHLEPPAVKAPGDTHIKNMDPDLKVYIIKDLSQEKSSRVDWRILAERFGIDADTIAHWEDVKLSLPMGKVLAAWAGSPGATVRLLHRHLMSPQMRCTFLAKRIADYYEVD